MINPTQDLDLGSRELHALAAAKRHFFAFWRRHTPRHAEWDAEVAFMRTGVPVPVTHMGEELEVRTWGRGPTIVLVHGLFLSGGKFRRVIPALVDAGMRAVAFDAPGHGASAGEFVDSDDISHALITICNRLGGVAGLVAHSMGSVWALRAMYAGLEVPAAVCIGAAVGMEYVEYYVTRHLTDPDVTEHFRRLTAAFGAGAAPPLAIAEQLAARALIIHDRDDPLAPFEGGQALAHAWQSSRSVWTSRLGHFKTLADSAVIREITVFLSEQPRPCEAP